MNSFSKCHEEIADGLAGPGFAVIDDFLLPHEVASILNLDVFKDALLKFRKAAIGPERMISSTRGDYIQWIDRQGAPVELMAFLGKLDALITYLNQALFLSLKDHEVHMTIYPAGSYYARHLDQFKSSGHRKLSVICYLNEDWQDVQGGQLRMYLPEGATDVFPMAGRLVCFRSDQVEHEVLPATRDRLSLTGWMLDRPTEWSHL